LLESKPGKKRPPTRHVDLKVESAPRYRDNPGMGAPRRGTIPNDGVVGLLRSFEETRANGLLVYRGADGQTGEVWLRLGTLDPTQEESPDGSDPVERFLATRGGTYEILDQLPPLEDTMGSAQARSGSLSRHSVADLMSYAESAALSGLVRVESGGRIAEIVYSEGMLGSIFLDGAENDVDALFGWGEGSFVIRANTPPSLAPPTGPAPIIVERALGSLLDEAAQRRPRPASVAPPRLRTLGPPRRESTVRIVMLGGRGEALLKLAPSGEVSLTPKTSADADASRASREASRPSVARATLPRVGDRARSRSLSSRESESEPEPIVPRLAMFAIAVLLLAGIGAFIASLLSIG
jgi:hypothetical protein